jgi:type IV fimbrial biogenesis protein FimT
MTRFKAKLGDENRQGRESPMPFIGLLMPFVWPNKPSIMPFIGHNRPLVCIDRISGFTLIELIVTVVIAGILVTVAVPSYRNFVKTNQVSTQINNLVADLTLARTEAVKRMMVVTVCNSDNQQGCTDTSWTNGRVVWADANVDGVVDSGEILRAATAVSEGNTLAAANFIDLNRIQFQPSGSPDSSGTFELCDSENAYCRCLTIGTTGDSSLSNGTCP